MVEEGLYDVYWVPEFTDDVQAAVEVKLGGEKLVEDGVTSLKRLQRKIEEKSEEPSPSFLMVLTAFLQHHRCAMKQKS